VQHGPQLQEHLAVALTETHVVRATLVRLLVGSEKPREDVGESHVAHCGHLLVLTPWGTVGQAVLAEVHNVADAVTKRERADVLRLGELGQVDTSLLTSLTLGRESTRLVIDLGGVLLLDGTAGRAEHVVLGAVLDVGHHAENSTLDAEHHSECCNAWLVEQLRGSQTLDETEETSCEGVSLEVGGKRHCFFQLDGL